MKHPHTTDTLPPLSPRSGTDKTGLVQRKLCLDPVLNQRTCSVYLRNQIKSQTAMEQSRPSFGLLQHVRKMFMNVYYYRVHSVASTNCFCLSSAVLQSSLYLNNWIVGKRDSIKSNLIMHFFVEMFVWLQCFVEMSLKRLHISLLCSEFFISWVTTK